MIMEIEFNSDSSGTQWLSGLVFDNSQFAHLEILPPAGRIVRIEDCQFLSCSTSPGTCVIGRGVILNNVVFSDLNCGDAIRLSSEATLKRVVVKGSRPKALIVQPEFEDHFKMTESTDTEYQLDITEFIGVVTIIGIRGKMVRKDSARHVTVHANWKDEVDWKGLGIGPFSYWKIFIKKLAVFNAEEGVFSLPDSSDKHYSETMRERELIEKSGLHFD